MGHLYSDLFRRIEEAALNPDLWTGVFQALFPLAKGDLIEVTISRHTCGELKKTVAVHARQGAEVSCPEVELVTFAGPAPGSTAIEFRLDDDLYDIQVASPGAGAVLLRKHIQEVEDKIIHAIKVNRAVLSTKTSVCQSRSLLSRQQDPVFGLTLDGVIT